MQTRQRTVVYTKEASSSATHKPQLSHPNMKKGDSSFALVSSSYTEGHTLCLRYLSHQRYLYEYIPREIYIYRYSHKEIHFIRNRISLQYQPRRQPLSKFVTQCGAGTVQLWVKCVSGGQQSSQNSVLHQQYSTVTLPQEKTQKNVDIVRFRQKFTKMCFTS